MMVAMNGTIQGNKIVADEDISMYDGTKVIITILNKQTKNAKREPVSWDDFSVSSDRPAFLDEYMKEMRDNDRI